MADRFHQIWKKKQNSEAISEKTFKIFKERRTDLWMATAALQCTTTKQNSKKNQLIKPGQCHSGFRVVSEKRKKKEQTSSPRTLTFCLTTAADIANETSHKCSINFDEMFYQISLFAPNDPKLILTTIRSQVPICVLVLSPVWNFTPFRSTISHPWLTGHFRISAPDDHIITFSTRSKVPDICITRFPNLTGFCFALLPTIFEWQAILIYTQVHRMTVSTTKYKVPYVCCNSVPDSVSLIAVFELQAILTFELVPILREVFWMTTKWHYKGPIRSQVPHICATGVPEFQVTLSFALRTATF